MDPILQYLLNVAGAALVILLGWIWLLLRGEVSSIRKELEAHEERMHLLAADINALKLEVAKDCVQKDEYREDLRNLHKKLDEIMTLLQQKADR